MKLDEAAKTTANMKARGFTSIACAVVIAMGSSSATVALFDITSVSSMVAPKNAASSASGPSPPTLSIIPFASIVEAPVFSMAAPSESMPASRKSTFHSIAP